MPKRDRSCSNESGGQPRPARRDSIEFTSVEPTELFAPSLTSNSTESTSVEPTELFAPSLTSNSTESTSVESTELLAPNLKMSTEATPETEAEWQFDHIERNPDDLVEHGYRPVWTDVGGYPGTIPDDIAVWIGPDESRYSRMIGPLSSLLWLAKMDDLADAIDSPEFTMCDDVALIPINASIRSMVPQMYEEGKVSGAVFRNYCYPPPDFSIMAFPLRHAIIPPGVTESLTSCTLRDLFPFLRQQCFPREILAVRKQSVSTNAQDIERDFISSLGGNLLFRGLTKWALISAMSFFVPTLISNCPDHEFGPGIYTTPSLGVALRYAGINGAIMVFQNTDFRGLDVWEPSVADWDVMTRYWTGKVLSDAEHRAPPGWQTDFIRGGISQAKSKKDDRTRVPGPDIQVVGVSQVASAALASSLRMIIWLY